MVGIRTPLVIHPLQAMVTEPLKPWLNPIIVSASMHVYVSQSTRGELVAGASLDPYELTSMRSTLGFAESLATHMAGMGMDVDDARVRSHIAIIDLADLRVQLDAQGMTQNVDWMGQLIKQLANYRDSIGFEVVVFDSLGAFFTLTKMENPRDEVFRFFEAIRRMGLTGMIICEMMGEMKNQFGEFGIEDYLSDGVIHVTMERRADEVQRKLSVVKMRHTKHLMGYHPLDWDEDTQRFIIG